MRQATLQSIKDSRWCTKWSDKRIEELWGTRRKKVKLSTFAACKEIPVHDIMWVLSRHTSLYEESYLDSAVEKVLGERVDCDGRVFRGQCRRIPNFESRARAILVKTLREMERADVNPE